VSTNRLAVSSKPATLVSDDLAREQMTTMETFETYRLYLFSIAYRMLGSVMDAEDMVQETYLRYQAASPEALRSLKAYLTTILTRLSIDQLHLAYRQREDYLGPWLPEPIITASVAAPNAEEDLVMRESLSQAFLVMLENLPPVERAVFLLREVFDYDYAEIATFVGRSESTCRQIFHRAKKHLADRRQPESISPEMNRRLLTGFLEAVQTGNTNGLLDILAEDVTLVADGGGKVPGAAIHPVSGRAAVAQFAVGASKRFLPSLYRVELSEVNYQPAVIARAGDRVLVVMTVDVEAGQVKTVRFIANPDKLAHLRTGG
jgi:RNA polymerase sigma-70 factor (ECF subfamily)